MLAPIFNSMSVLLARPSAPGGVWDEEGKAP